MKAAVAAVVLGAVPALARPQQSAPWGYGNSSSLAYPTSYGSATTVTNTLTHYTTICPESESWPTESGNGNGWTSVTVTWGDHWTSTQSWQHTSTVVLTETETVPPGYSVPTGYNTSPVSGATGTAIGGATGTGVATGSATSTAISTGGGHKKCNKKPKTVEKCVPCEGQPDSNPDNFCGLNVNTNYYDQIPKTCRTVEYTFNITQQNISPDGVPRMALLVNGQMPGPAINVNWGDTVVVHIHNNLPASIDNGTTIHWHGIHQNWTVANDGVPSITQCPIVPGGVQTVEWVATNYGTSWYHSHFALQTWEGIFGPIIINGPASAAYDEEATVMLQDWSHETVDALYDSVQSVQLNTNRSNPVMDLGLINGMNVWTPPGPPGSAPTTGKRWQLDVVSGKSYRLRIVNSAIAAVFVFYVDQHELTVIATDFVPVQPFTVQTLPINIGQRYDVILTANQPVGNYYMRSDNQQPCSPMIYWNNTNAIVHYQGADSSEPTSQPYGYAPTCGDVDASLIHPVVPWNAGQQPAQTLEENVLIGVDPSNSNLYKWTLSGTTFQSQWGEPTLLSILENNTIPDFSGDLAISVPNLGEWVYVIIESVIPVAHPIHLHGHDFLILAQGAGAYNSSIPLNLNNPARRDVAQMPANVVEGQGSYLVVAFYTNNPGVWLMHCHIGWHAAMGFALQIIEAQDQIQAATANDCTVENTCAAWNSYASANNIFVNDSGI